MGLQQCRDPLLTGAADQKQEAFTGMQRPMEAEVRGKDEINLEGLVSSVQCKKLEGKELWGGGCSACRSTREHCITIVVHMH